MSKNFFVTKGALTNMVKRLVKEAADPAFVTEPSVVAPPIETSPQAEHQVDQGVLPVEDPEWVPATQEELTRAVTQYIARTPEKELADVWNDIRTSVKDAVERSADEHMDVVLEITKKHGHAAGMFAAYLCEAKDDDEWNMGMQGWDPGDENEGTPFDEFGTDIDLSDPVDDPAAAAAKRDIADDTAAKRAKRMKRRPDEVDLSDEELIAKRDTENNERAAAKREIGSFWDEPIPPAIEKYFVELGEPVPAEGSSEWNAVYRFMRNKSINIREKLRFIATLDDVQWESYLDDATDLWLEMAREHFSGNELVVTANNPDILYDLVTFKTILNDVIVKAMFDTLAKHGYAGGKTVPQAAEEKLGFRAWKDSELERTGKNPYKATSAADKYKRQLGKPAPADIKAPGTVAPVMTPDKSKPAAKASPAPVQAAKRGSSTAGTTKWTPETLGRMIKHAKATNNASMLAWAEAELARQEAK